MNLDALFAKRPNAPPPAPKPERKEIDVQFPVVIPFLKPLPDPVLFVSWDTETYPITEHEIVPPLVCVQTQVGEVLASGDVETGDITVWGADEVSKNQGVDFVFYILEHRPEMSLISLNGFYDWCVILKHRDWNPRLLRLVFEAFKNGRIRDCVPRAKLNAVEFDWLDHDPDIGQPPTFSMEQLAKKYLQESVEGKHGKDSWRLRYNELDGIPSAEWPVEAYNYAALDADYTWRIFLAICKHSTASPDESMQTLAEWSLYLAGVWGLYVDEARVEVLEKNILPTIKEGVALLSDPKVGAYVPEGLKFNKKRLAEEVEAVLGPATVKTPAGAVSLAAAQVARAYTARPSPFLDPRLSDAEKIAEAESRGDESWIEVIPAKKVMKVISGLVEEYYTSRGLPVPLTSPKPSISKKTGLMQVAEPRTKTSRDIIENVPALKPLADIGAAQKVESMYLSSKDGKVPIFKRKIVHPRWDGMKATGRVSVRNPNLNNMPRMAGVRECFRARPGYVLVSADYAQAELCSLAQVCIDKFGFSRMGELINEGMDLHLYLVSKLREQSYEWLVAHKKDPSVKQDRQGGKAANFGYPGGLGVAKFIQYAADTFGIELTIEEAEEWKNVWLREYPEMPGYFRWINERIKASPTGYFTITQHRTGRRRGRVGYCDGLNTLFQGLTADGAKHAMNLITEESMLDTSSPIYGFRLIAFIYDEIFGEMPDRGPEMNTAAARRLEQIMDEAMRVFTPDVIAKVEACLQYNWCKAAEPVWDYSTPSPLLYPHEHRGGRFLISAGGGLTLVERKELIKDLSEITNWENRASGLLVRLSDAPSDVQKEFA